MFCPLREVSGVAARSGVLDDYRLLGGYLAVIGLVGESFYLTVVC